MAQPSEVVQVIDQEEHGVRILVVAAQCGPGLRWHPLPFNFSEKANAEQVAWIIRAVYQRGLADGAGGEIDREPPTSQTLVQLMADRDLWKAAVERIEEIGCDRNLSATEAFAAIGGVISEVRRG